MPEHLVVPEGQESILLSVLTAGQLECEPTCPECDSNKVCRVIISRRDRTDIQFVPVEKLWRYAPGTTPNDEWTGAIAVEGTLRHGDFSFPSPRGGLISSNVNACVRCEVCGYCDQPKGFWPTDA